MDRMQRLRRRSRVFTLGFALICLCASLRGLAAEQTTSHSDEKIGAEAAVAVARQMGFYDNPVVAD